MRRLVVAFCLLLPFAAASAEAITIRDIIELSRAGLSDDVLLALIEVDGGVFPIDAATLTKLKAAGVSQPVIVAIVKSGRTRPVNDNQSVPVAAQEPPPPQIIVERPVEIVREVAVPVAVPIYVPVHVSGRSRVTRHDVDNRSVDVRAVDVTIRSRSLDVNQTAAPRYLTDTPRRRSEEPVYWGHGGKLRPDAWKPPEREKHKD